MRPLIERDLIAAYRLIVPTTVDIINEGREAAAQLFFVQMHKQQPGTVVSARIFDPKLVNAAQSTAESKRMLMDLIKAVLGAPGVWSSIKLPTLLADHGFTPHIAVHVSEAWTVVRKTPDMSMLPAECPDRREVLMINVHVREHSYTQWLPITTIGTKRHCELLPWAPHDPRGPQMIGGIFSMQRNGPMS